jgi:hypothetical protein
MRNFVHKTITCALLIIISMNGALANNGSKLPAGFNEKKNNTVSFTENKGQVCNQFDQPRPDVLFSGVAKGFFYHLTKNGFCYQMYKTSTKGKLEEKQELHTIQRVDVSFLNTNVQKEIKATDPIPGYANYYLPQCPNGALNVKTFKEVKYNGIYNNIDLKWYDNNGDLEYDFIVKPSGKIKDIVLEIKGATLSLNSNGSLIIKTELGTIEEMAPQAFQEGKLIPCSWKLKGNELSFNVPNYNHAKELIIDPISRIWGTYYGGGGSETIFGIASDNLNNVYATGSTGTNSTPTLIATVGSHQATKGGGIDAFLVKFNSSGVRLWGTYYGGAGSTSSTIGRSCEVYNTNGDIFMSGATSATAGISTSGAHQTTSGGGTDGFLVRFNSAGVRYWATYYGGVGNEEGYSTSVDGSGNVYLTGSTTTTLAGVMSTSGSHQVALGGFTDSYLVKFNITGVRQWGTYYGGASNDITEGCYATSSGDIYISGRTASFSGTIIATTGAHQTANGGGIDAFLVKFNTTGVRQWGTYYGGTGTDQGYRCFSNSVGDVFLVGSTNGSSTGIASAGAHQTANAGGDDAFVVKFNSAGLRSWGTYYGGTGTDNGYGIGSNIIGEVFFGGATASASGISTAGGFQPTYGGGTDAFMTILNGSGALQWATYYGGTGSERGWAGISGNNGAFYLGGDCVSVNSISSTGAHQTTFGGGSNDGFLVKFVDCTTASVSPNGQTNVLCNGNSTGSATVTASGGSGFTYTWSPSGGNSNIGTSLSAGNYTCTAQNNCGNTATLQVSISQPPAITVNVSSNNTIACTGISSTLSSSASGGTGSLNYNWVSGPATSSYVVNPISASTIFSVNVTDANSCITSNTILINRNITPTITVNSGTICSGTIFTMSPTGANTYTFSSGSNTVSPLSNTNYTIIGSSIQGCTNSVVSNLVVNTTPTITVNSGTICSGSIFTMVPGGASTYTFSGGSNTVSPNSNTAYTITGSSAQGCTNTAISNLVVNTTPTLTVNGGAVCPGGSFTFTPSGANTYTFSSGSAIVTPTATTNYTIAGTSAQGCNASQVVATVTYTSSLAVSITASNTVCSGQAILITAGGASSYTWSTGATTSTIAPTPTANISYTVIGASGTCSNTAIKSITVNPSPTVTAVSNASLICTGQTATLTASGANSYVWNPSGSGSTIVVSPTITSSYTVNGTDANGCSSLSVITQSVSLCTDVNSFNKLENLLVYVYPNPTTGELTINLNSDAQIVIQNALGQIMYSAKLISGQHYLDVKNYAVGVYFVKVIQNNNQKTIKLIKE